MAGGHGGGGGGGGVVVVVAVVVELGVLADDMALRKRATQFR